MSVPYRGRGVTADTQTITTVAAVLTDLTENIVSALIQSDPGNSNDIYVGDAVAQPIVLKANSSFAVTMENLKKFYFKTATGTATLNILALS